MSSRWGIRLFVICVIAIYYVLTRYYADYFAEHPDRYMIVSVVMIVLCIVPLLYSIWSNYKQR